MAYQLRKENHDLLLCADDGFSPEKIFDCGQCFRFAKGEDGSFEGVARGRLLRLRSEGEAVRIFDTEEEEFQSVWRDYFDLDRDYNRMRRDILRRGGRFRDHLKRAVEQGEGIRLLRQDPWEALCSFIISQNNNIPRIVSLVERLARECGEPLDENHFAFPAPERVLELGEEKLREMKFGFRAGYLTDAAKAICEGRVDLESVAKADTSAALAALESIRGVGVKVASCTLLFGFSRLDAFPVDVWMKKVIDTRFEGEEPDLGRYRGLAQQYLFYYERFLCR